MLKGKHIILGICGGIAAYKSAYLLRLFIKAGAEVQVVITPAGKEFITPVTLSALSGKPVISEFFTANTGSWNSHVDLGLWADAMVIAPATASTIGKMANGIADNMLVTTYLSAKAPVFVAPAMRPCRPSHTDNGRPDIRKNRPCALHRQLFVGQDGICLGRGMRHPRSQCHTHQRPGVDKSKTCSHQDNKY